MPQIRTIQSSGSIPTTNQLLLGDIAINTVDGKAYIKKYSGSVQSILEIGSGIVPASASYASTASYSFFAVTAAFAQNFNPSATASYALQALTSSYALVALSSSYSNTANSASYALSSSFSVSSSFAVSSSRATTSSFAISSSFVNTLNQNVIVTGSLTVSSTTVGTSENTVTLGPAPAGGAGEGGQLGFNATGGTYTSASFIDLWQNKLRILKGTNAGSTAEVANWDLQTLYMNLPGGAITMPQRPAFRVTGSSGYNPTSGTVVSGSSVGIDYNQGGYYNNTNGQFTCPVAGLYHVWYVGRTFAASLSSVALYKNNTGTPLAFWESNINSGHFGVSAVVNLAVNDVITAKVTAGQVTFDGNDNWGAAYIG